MPNIQWTLGKLAAGRRTYYGIIPPDLQRIISKCAKNTYNRKRVDEMFSYIISDALSHETSLGSILFAAVNWGPERLMRNLEGRDIYKFWVKVFRHEFSTLGYITGYSTDTCQSLHGARNTLFFMSAVKRPSEQDIRKMARGYGWDNVDELVRIFAK